MMLELLALVALLRVDPAGDAHGAGDLVPPSAAVYADRSPFDLLDVEVGGEDVLTVRVTLAGIPDPGRLRNGLTLPIIDVYIDLEEGGESVTLPGVGMAMDAAHGWDVALRVHGDGAYARRADDPPSAFRTVTVSRDGDVLILRTSLPAPDTIRDVQAVTGVYDPFSPEGWRPLASGPSPWAFSSETPAPPVVDLLASSDQMQRSAIRSYVLPSSRDAASPVGWLLLMFGGLGVAVAGLWLRRHAPTSQAAASADRTPLPDGASEAPRPEGEGAEPRPDVEAEAVSPSLAANEAGEAGEDGDDGEPDSIGDAWRAMQADASDDPVPQDEATFWLEDDSKPSPAPTPSGTTVPDVGADDGDDIGDVAGEDLDVGADADGDEASGEDGGPGDGARDNARDNARDGERLT